MYDVLRYSLLSATFGLHHRLPKGHDVGNCNYKLQFQLSFYVTYLAFQILRFCMDLSLLLSLLQNCFLKDIESPNVVNPSELETLRLVIAGRLLGTEL